MSTVPNNNNEDDDDGSNINNNNNNTTITGSSSGNHQNPVVVVDGTKGILDRHGMAVADYIRDSRFSGLSGIVEASVHSSVDNMLGSIDAPFPISANDLAILSQERTHVALADLLDLACTNLETRSGYKTTTIAITTATQDNDIEQQKQLDPNQKLYDDIRRLTQQLRDDATKVDNDKFNEHTLEGQEIIKNADMAANVVTSVLLRSSPTTGIDPREVEHRKDIFGTNAITEKQLDSFCKLCYEAIQDFVLILLLVLGVISIIVETTTNKDCSTCWIEGAAILVTVGIVVNVMAGIDYMKQFAFQRLSRSLHETNIKQVIRDGVLCSTIDDDIVVGDILSVNSHNLASIPCDCIVLGPATSDLLLNESSLTGESKLIRKKPGDIVLSGTNVESGSSKMVVIAVGINSVAGKIKARVYESNTNDGNDDDLEGNDTHSPLFVKLDILAKQISLYGTGAAIFSLVISCIIGFGFHHDPVSELINYVITAITVLAVAVPEGLPLAVTLALAFSSSKMMQDQNLVKHLDACETMGCATTICTDKTGTLTANKMTARAIYTGKTNYLVTDPAVRLGDYIKSHEGGLNSQVITQICKAIAINTMNESILYFKNDSSIINNNDNKKESDKVIEGGTGNPTEVALLVMTHELGYDYEEIRNTTKGRSDKGALGASLADGKQYGFTSARKMMSWAVLLENGGGYRIYTKGAAEVILQRCKSYVSTNNDIQQYTEEDRIETTEIASAYARRGMRCLALAYRDLPEGFDLEEKTELVSNSDGTSAFLAETELTALALVGIEDPLRPEVPGAIEKCYQAGIDVRMVTGDNPNTAVSIAYQAGIIRDFHFVEGTTERVAVNLKEHVLMEGKDFRKAVYRTDNADGGEKKFDQQEFDKIWPHLRVLARSSPDDKLTLAHGLNQSNLFADKATCEKLLSQDNITVFPDRQVVAMTGDGTNDAPALKRADIGFAMGLAGTQIAKDAADIILLDDNFASIVTAAKWGRNIYASIQKFLQFQLTVNIAAVVTALVGSIVYQQSPLAAIQLLWVNLLMDSLASLCLASEPPVDELLLRSPVNRTDSMITKRMRANMIGESIYQITVVMLLLFKGPKWFDLVPGSDYPVIGEASVHYTLIFNTFVYMTLFNEINARKLKGEVNVFAGIFNNSLFVSIWLSCACLQAFIVQFGSVAFAVTKLNAKYWGISLLLGLGTLPTQQIINVCYSMAQSYNIKRNDTRKKKAAQLITERV